MLSAGWVEFLSGTAGGVASVLVSHPFDTVKTRLQVQAPRGGTQPLMAGVPLLATHYTGALNAFARIVREERVVGLFRGVLSPMVGSVLIQLGVAAMNASIFYLYDTSLAWLQGSRARIAQPTLGETCLAGIASGVCSALLTAPMELFKIQQQVNTSTTQRTTYLQAIRKVWQAGGVRAIYHGLGATCIRDTGYGPYFLVYTLLNRWMLTWHQGPHPTVTHAEMAVSGALAGVVAWLATYWADVVKTRIQAEPLAALRNPTPSFVAVLRATYRQGGLPALFAGAGTTVVRAIPANAALVRMKVLTKFVVYEAAKRELRS